MEELVNIFHRVEWRMVGGNPVERSYDKFCKMHNGTKHILKDALGDMSWYNATKTLKILNNLNGNIHLIKGNHDDKILHNREIVNRLCEITDYKELYLDKNKGVVLCHYPIPCFKNHFRGWYHLYGHVHVSFEENMIQNFKLQMEELHEVPLKMANVGCMMPRINYTPRTLEEIFEITEG